MKMNFLVYLSRLFRNGRKLEHPYYSMVDHDDFDQIYSQLLKQTGTKPSLWRKDRFYNLYTLSKYAQTLDGGVIELGVYMGLSSSILLKLGNNLWVVDSFEGLSQPTKSDGGLLSKKGHFSVSEKKVILQLENTARDSGVDCHILKGWIPEVLKKLPEQKWRFVHIDVDLVDPTLTALEYFYPRMVSGGIILCDDYASNVWPNLKKEMNKYLDKKNIQGFQLSTCQLVIVVK